MCPVTLQCLQQLARCLDHTRCFQSDFYSTMLPAVDKQHHAVFDGVYHGPQNDFQGSTTDTDERQESIKHQIVRFRKDHELNLDGIVPINPGVIHFGVWVVGTTIS